ncbi:MAG: MFS transporter [Bacteroidales bacterium]|nr:MFS transporter [Bacteroidales bacterium]
MTTDSDQKSVLSSYRMFFAYAGSFIALFAWEPLCNTFAPAEKVDDSISRIELSSDNSTMTVEVPVDVLEYFEVEKSEMQVSDMLAVLRQHEAKELDSKSTYDQIKKFDIEIVNHELDSLNKAHSLNLGSITVNEIGNQYKNISLSPTAWGNAMIVIAVFCFALFILCFLMTREHVKSVSTVSVGKDLKLLLKNKPWWILIGAALASNLFNTVRGTTTAYFFNDYLTRFVEMDSSLAFLLSASIFLSIGEVANMVGVVIAVPMSKHLGKKSTYMISMAALIGLSIAFFFLPATSGGYLAMVAFQIIISVFTGIISPLVWSMYADVADYSELKDGTASTGLIFSSASMAQKFGGAFGGSAVMWLLAAFGYNTAEGAVQTEEALTGLKILMSWVPAIVAALSILVVWFYPLTKKKMQGVQTDLAAKRGDVVAHK